jgi:hypothetical protein
MKQEKHGKSHSPEYQAWRDMKYRCYNPNVKSYKYYGARGIKVCDQWRNSFTKFLEDVGERPGKGYSLDRIDNAGNYEPGNVRWETQENQMRNTRLLRKSKSGVRGVIYHKTTPNQKKVWRAQITVDYKVVYLGYHETIEEAKQARAKAEKELW